MRENQILTYCLVCDRNNGEERTQRRPSALQGSPARTQASRRHRENHWRPQGTCTGCTQRAHCPLPGPGRPLDSVEASALRKPFACVSLQQGPLKIRHLSPLLTRPNFCSSPRPSRGVQSCLGRAGSLQGPWIRCKAMVHLACRARRWPGL